jgi:hypothetical protein
LDCAQSILAVLREVYPLRLTARQIHAALVQRRNPCWSLTTIQKHLSVMMKQELLVNPPNLLPKGYSLSQPPQPNQA